ncbi:MAG: adenylate kinase [Salinisphaera sp.]|nr:adenylate kinase [Salinisphaera sp.]
MLKIVLLGAPGSGKGTQSLKLVAEYGVPQVSTGDLLRHAVAEQTELGLKAKAAMDAGELVSDDIVVGMIRERLDQPDAENGFILDGFPRSQAQAAALDVLLSRLDRPLQRVVHLEVDNEEIVQRLMSRGRADDNEETIRNRLAVFQEQTEPLVQYYKDQGLLVAVKGVGDVDEIFARIKAALDAA